MEVVILPAEMHCHTNRSDGSDSPEFVIRLAKQMGLSALAITDHDSYAGDYDAEGLGRSLGMRVINGASSSNGGGNGMFCSSNSRLASARSS